VRQRLLLSYLTLTVFLLAVLEIPLGLSYASGERQDLTAKVERDAVALATIAAPGRALAPQLRAIVQRYRAQTGGRVLIVGPTGQRVYDSGPGLGGTSYASRPEIGQALNGQVATGVRHSNSLGHDLLYVAVPVAAAGKVQGAVRITYPTSAVDARVHRYWLILVAIAGLVLLAALAIGLAFARSISRPLEALRLAAARAGEGDLATRAPTGQGPPEVRAVARAFNETAAKLEALLHAQDEFVADASHQLRSPLAALRLRLENLERDVAPAGRTGLEGAASEVERLSRLVDGLLALARADRAPSTAVRIDLAPLVHERLLAWAAYAEEHEVELRERLEPVAALGTAGRLEQVLDNLLANALEVAPPGSAVTVSATMTPALAELRVRDEGPGLSDEERARAFDRFWRAGAHSGTGLGLSIVRRLVEADGGSAELRAAPGGGIEAVVQLPRAPGLAARLPPLEAEAPRVQP
jgi:signal transduction histidine kinase